MPVFKKSKLKILLTKIFIASFCFSLFLVFFILTIDFTQETEKTAENSTSEVNLLILSEDVSSNKNIKKYFHRSLNTDYIQVTITYNYIPSVGTVTLNEGDDITLTENATATVQATTTVTDTNGYSDITSIIGKIYRSGVGTTCSADNNNCYEDSACATTTPCSGNSCTAVCDYNVWFHAEPTDTGSPWSSEYWEAWIKAIDSSNASSSATSTGVELNTLQALDTSSLYERYNTGDNSVQGTGVDTYWMAQTFTVGNSGLNEDHNIIKVKLKVYRTGSPGTTTISIKATDEDGAPTSTDLTSVAIDGSTLSASAQWTEFSLPSCSLASSTKYAIVFRGEGLSGSDFIWWRQDSSSPTYTGGPRYISSDSGSTWTADTSIDFMFEEYGDGANIDYGNIVLGEDTGTLKEVNNIINTGNNAIDIYFYGDNMDQE